MHMAWGPLFHRILSGFAGNFARIAARARSSKPERVTLFEGLRVWPEPAKNATWNRGPGGSKTIKNTTG